MQGLLVFGPIFKHLAEINDINEVTELLYKMKAKNLLCEDLVNSILKFVQDTETYDLIKEFCCCVK